MVLAGRQILVSAGLGFPPGYPASVISRLDLYVFDSPPGLVCVLVASSWPRAYENGRLYFFCLNNEACGVQGSIYLL